MQQVHTHKYKPTTKLRQTGKIGTLCQLLTVLQNKSLGAFTSLLSIFARVTDIKIDITDWFPSLARLPHHL